MIIVQIMPEFGLAGAEIMCENLMYMLRKLGHKVIAVSLYDFHSSITERLENAGIEIRYLGKKSGLDIYMIPKLIKIFKETGAEVVHTHRYCAQYAIPAAIFSGVKCRLHTVHNVAQQENGRLARCLNKFFFKFCGLIPVALSKQIQMSISEEYGVEPEKVPVIFNGINLEKCMPKSNYAVNGNFKVLHIGRFSEQKNHVGLLKAFRVFHDRHPDSELWLIGDGAKRKETEQYVIQNDLEDAVKFLGLQSHIYGYLHDADIFVLPSHYEGMPMTLIEAMGTGLPIVATAVGGVTDMLNEDFAKLVSVEVDRIVEAFEEYYGDADLRGLHGQRAREASKCFSAEEMAKKYSDLIQCRRSVC